MDISYKWNHTICGALRSGRFIHSQCRAQSPVFVISIRSGAAPLVWLLDQRRNWGHPPHIHPTRMVRSRKDPHRSRMGDTGQLLIPSGSLGAQLGDVAGIFLCWQRMLLDEQSPREWLLVYCSLPPLAKQTDPSQTEARPTPSNVLRVCVPLLLPHPGSPSHRLVPHPDLVSDFY